jgi:predicted Fe-S protein YdhL (DUF1289 family)
MFDPIPRGGPVTLIETPCTKICTLDTASQICLGCGRNLREIERWATLAASERARVMTELPARLAKLRARPVAGGTP